MINPQCEKLFEDMKEARPHLPLGAASQLGNGFGARLARPFSGTNASVLTNTVRLPPH